MMPQIEARSERLQTDDDQHDECGGERERQTQNNLRRCREAAPSPAAVTATAAAVGAGATASCTSRPQSRQTVASAFTGSAQCGHFFIPAASSRCSSAFAFGFSRMAAGDHHCQNDSPSRERLRRAADRSARTRLMTSTQGA